MTCLECKHINKKKKSRSCPNYIYCNRLEYWTNKDELCSLMRQIVHNNFKHIEHYIEK